MPASNQSGTPGGSQTRRDEAETHPQPAGPPRAAGADLPAVREGQGAITSAPSPSAELAALAEQSRGGDGSNPADPRQAAPSPPLLLVFLRVGRRWFAVRSESVREVGTKGYVTRVPTAPVHVLGVTLVRGRLVPVLALEGLLGELGTADVAYTLPRLVVLRHEETEIALVADETRGIIERPVDVEAASARSGDRPRYLGTEFGWEGKLVCMIDVPALITAATPGGSGAS